MKVKRSNREQDGMAVIVVIAFLSILLIFVAGNLRMLHLLRNDLKLVEQQQTNRLAVAGTVTNATVTTNPHPASASSK
jgi:hypothetical protein